jgi:hypothetical protein
MRFALMESVGGDTAGPTCYGIVGDDIGTWGKLMFGIHSSSSTNIIYVTCILVKLSTSKLCIRWKPFGSNSYKAVQLLTCELAFSCICPHVLHSIMLKTLNLKMLHVLIL